MAVKNCVKMDIIKNLKNLSENKEAFDHFKAGRNLVHIRFRELAHSELSFVSEIIGRDWLPDEEQSFIFVDACEKPKAATPAKQAKVSTAICKTVEKKFFSSTSTSKTFSTPKSGYVDGSPLLTSFMEVSTICVQTRKTIRLPSTPTLELNVFPMPPAVARGILGEYNVQMKENDAKLSSIWIICDGDEPQKTFLIGGFVEKSNNNRAIINNFNVTCRSVPDSSHLPTLASLLNELKSKTHVTNVVSRFNVLEAENSFVNENDTLDTTSSLVVDKNAELYLEAEWKNVTNIMEKPQNGAKITIVMTPAMFDPRSPLATSYPELKRLLVLSEGLVDRNAVDWAQLADDDVDVVKKVRLLIEKVRDEPNNFFVESPSFESSVDAIVDSAIFVRRQNFDFTEMLWQILKNCSSENILIQCLNVVYDCLCAQNIRPMIHPGNVTQMTRFIRDSFKEKLDKPTLDGSAPLRILFEIGVDKLIRDYVTFFNDFKDIIPTQFVEEILRKETKSKMFILMTLHWCLQVFVMGRCRLEMVPNSLRQLMKKAFEMVKKGDVSLFELENFELTTTVTTKDIKILVENNWIHSVWRLKLESNDEGNYRTSIVFQINDRSPFPYGDNSSENLFITQVLKRSNTF